MSVATSGGGVARAKKRAPRWLARDLDEALTLLAAVQVAKRWGASDEQARRIAEHHLIEERAQKQAEGERK